MRQSDKFGGNEEIIRAEWSNWSNLADFGQFVGEGSATS